MRWPNRRTLTYLRYQLNSNIPEKSDQENNKKKNKINVKMPHVNRKTTSEKRKFNSNKKLGLE